MSHFFDGLDCGLSVGKPDNNGLLMKKNAKGMILKQKGTRMAEDGDDWNGLESLAIFSKYMDDDIVPLTFLICTLSCRVFTILTDKKQRYLDCQIGVSWFIFKNGNLVFIRGVVQLAFVFPAL